jgi:hypothetical protein
MAVIYMNNVLDGTDRWQIRQEWATFAAYFVRSAHLLPNESVLIIF